MHHADLDGGNANRVAIGRSGGNRRVAHDAAAAGTVDNIHRLAEVFLKQAANDAGSGIGSAASTPGHDQGDGPVGIILGHHWQCGRQAEHGGRTGGEPMAAKEAVWSGSGTDAVGGFCGCFCHGCLLLKELWSLSAFVHEAKLSACYTANPMLVSVVCRMKYALCKSVQTLLGRCQRLKTRLRARR